MFKKNICRYAFVNSVGLFRVRVFPVDSSTVLLPLGRWVDGNLVNVLICWWNNTTQLANIVTNGVGRCCFAVCSPSLPRPVSSSLCGFFSQGLLGIIAALSSGLLDVDFWLLPKTVFWFALLVLTSSFSSSSSPS